MAKALRRDVPFFNKALAAAATPLFLHANSRIKDPVHHQGIEIAQVDGKYFHAILQDMLSVGRQHKVKLNGIFYIRSDFSVQHNLYFSYPANGQHL